MPYTIWKTAWKAIYECCWQGCILLYNTKVLKTGLLVEQLYIFLICAATLGLLCFQFPAMFIASAIDNPTLYSNDQKQLLEVLCKGGPIVMLLFAASAFIYAFFNGKYDHNVAKLCYDAGLLLIMGIAIYLGFVLPKKSAKVRRFVSP